jgi:transcriptional regulator GlxA family with amidase domain
VGSNRRRTHFDNRYFRRCPQRCFRQDATRGRIAQYGRACGCTHRRANDSGECGEDRRFFQWTPALDSIEQALAAALVEGHAVDRRSVAGYSGGLTPVCLRRVIDLVEAKIGFDLTLEEMAESVDLSRTHFTQMFRRSTGQSPHQFLLLQRIGRAKEMLRAPETRILDVAVACGFKTQQHFARAFRTVCGASPTEYRRECLL